MRMAPPPTPRLTACTAVWIFGIMPPLIVPETMSARADGVSMEMSVLPSSRTPLTSVSRSSRLAWMASATAPAAVPRCCFSRLCTVVPGSVFHR
ncbi:hypothetical protein M885DRAFT_517568 [Pelagophyceae sp. CCMP2097]|nr:hypothetical protein M885DRAFT_517568 [Pelagophyceae sp. CCMP2097]